MNAAERNYGIVTAAYWGFTLTDGALRMLVLLHFYKLGYSPFMLAFLFLLYEAAGVLANLVGGWLAMWAVGVVAIMVLRGLTRRAAQFIMSTLDTWSADVARRRADERLWAMAQSDARLMADLQSAFSRSEAPHELKDIFALAQRRADHIAQQHLYHI